MPLCDRILALSDLMSGVSNYILAMTIIVSINVLDKKLPSAVFHFSPECQNGELVGHDVLSTENRHAAQHVRCFV